MSDKILETKYNESIKLEKICNLTFIEITNMDGDHISIELNKEEMKIIGERLLKESGGK